MKTLHKLTIIYMAGFGLLAVVIFTILYSLDQLHASPEILAIKTRISIIAGISLLASSAGALILYVIYQKNITRPLGRITSTALQLKNGRLETFPLIKTAEMRSLMENLYSIEKILKDNNEELEKTFSREKNTLRTLNLLNDLNKTLLSKAMVYEFLEIILSSSTNIIKSEVGAIALLDRTSNQVTNFISNPSQHSGDAKTLAKTVMRELVDNKKPLRLNRNSGEEFLEASNEKMDLDVKSVLAVPILVEDEILGGLIFINRIGGANFSMENKTHAVFISYQAAMAIEKSLVQEALMRSEKTDELTGLDNHRAFHEKLHIELKRSERFNRQLSVLLIDIDFLKRFNEAFGQQNGDKAIKEISKILKDGLRRIDTAARYAGEAFALILPETAIEGAIQAAERIKRDVGTHPFLVQGNLTNLTVSIGISLYPHDAETKEELLANADNAIHYAKKTGRNKVVSFKEYKEEKEKQEELERLAQLEEQEALEEEDNIDFC